MDRAAERELLVKDSCLYRGEPTFEFCVKAQRDLSVNKDQREL
jgi:hypothetical protein